MVALKVCPNESGTCCSDGCEVVESYNWYFPDPAVKVLPKKVATGKRIKLEEEEEAMQSVGDELVQIEKIYQCRCVCSLAPPPPARTRVAHPPASSYHPPAAPARSLSHLPACA